MTDGVVVRKGHCRAGLDDENMRSELLVELIHDQGLFRDPVRRLGTDGSCVNRDVADGFPVTVGGRHAQRCRGDLAGQSHEHRQTEHPPAHGARIESHRLHRAFCPIARVPADLRGASVGEP